MKPLFYFLLLFILCSPYASEGIGGSEGGPGSRVWNLDIPRGFTPDWPMVRVHEGRNIPINKFCIQDQNTLRTLQKFGTFGVRFGGEEVIRIGTFNKKYQFADRYYDDFGCFGSWDPKCEWVNMYIEEKVEIPLYRGEPRATRGGMEDIRDFARRSRLEKMLEVNIPKCQ